MVNLIENYLDSLRQFKTPTRFTADALALKLEELKQACCASKNCGNTEAAKRREQGKPTSQNLRRKIPLDWRETFGN